MTIPNRTATGPATKAAPLVNSPDTTPYERPDDELPPAIRSAAKVDQEMHKDKANARREARGEGGEGGGGDEGGGGLFPSIASVHTWDQGAPSQESVYGASLVQIDGADFAENAVVDIDGVDTEFSATDIARTDDLSDPTILIFHGPIELKENPGTYNVTVRNPDTEGGTSNALQFLWRVPIGPSFTLDPDHGSADGGTTIDFDVSDWGDVQPTGAGDITVEIDGESVAVTPTGLTTGRVDTPAHAAGVVNFDLIVTVSGEHVSQGNRPFTYDAPIAYLGGDIQIGQNVDQVTLADLDIPANSLVLVTIGGGASGNPLRLPTSPNLTFNEIGQDSFDYTGPLPVAFGAFWAYTEDALTDEDVTIKSGTGDTMMTGAVSWWSNVDPLDPIGSTAPESATPSASPAATVTGLTPGSQVVAGLSVKDDAVITPGAETVVELEDHDLAFSSIGALLVQDHLTDEAETETDVEVTLSGAQYWGMFAVELLPL